jgi:hypothetical protein
MPDLSKKSWQYEGRHAVMHEKHDGSPIITTYDFRCAMKKLMTKLEHFPYLFMCLMKTVLLELDSVLIPYVSIMKPYFAAAISYPYPT